MLEDQFDPSVERNRKARADNSHYENWIKWLAKEEGLSEEIFVKAMLRDVATRIMNNRRELWEREAAKKARIITDCVNQHMSPPTNYWQAERKALQVYQQAEAFYAAIVLEK